MTISADRLLFGTDEPPAPSRTLHAGPLSAELQHGNLRDIRFAGTELVRAVSFLVRSPRWATYDAEIADLMVEERPQSFRVSYRATVRDGSARLVYVARIDGHADGALDFHCHIHPQTDFVTCRTGFVVLHPAQLAGSAVTVEHADGRKVERQFPLLIDPLQPMLDLRALTHAAAPGIVVACRMDGDVFEMEDQRNWSDASFKTYVRPLSRPWPYTLEAGSRSTQSVMLRVAPGASIPAADGGGEVVRVETGGAIGTMPSIGLGCTPAEARDALPHAARLAQAGVATLVCRFDPGQGHTADDLAAYRDLAQAIGAQVELQIVVQTVADYAAELRDVAATLRTIGLRPALIAVSPAPDLKSVTPGQEWPDCAPLALLYEAARAVFPGTKLAGGTFAYFTELNRKRPPLALLDAVTFSTSPLVHAADDRSVMESLEALPALAVSARAIVGDKALLVGPSAIGMRDNPYGPAPLENARGARLTMGGADPRQRGLLNAAWTLGYIARFAVGGAARIAVSAPFGRCGIIDEDGTFPVFAVIRGCSGLRGAALHKARASHPQRVAVLQVSAADRHELWLANLTGQTQVVRLPEPFAHARLHRLDLASLQGARGFDAHTEHAGAEIACSAYAVLRCVAPA